MTRPSLWIDQAPKALFETLASRIAAGLQARFAARDAVEDRLHERPLVPGDAEQLELEDAVDAELAALPLPAWQVETPADHPWDTWRADDEAAFLAVVDWALSEGFLSPDEEIPFCRARAEMRPRT